MFSESAVEEVDGFVGQTSTIMTMSNIEGNYLGPRKEALEKMRNWDTF